MNIKFDMEQCRSLQIEQSKRDDEIVKKGFIGNDGKHHEYEYDKKNHIYHTHMTNEEFYLKNDRKKLDNCQKCKLWTKCRIAEHTLTTIECIENNWVNEITTEINKKILERVLNKR
jgi:hypothetical protein